ncbi:UDP-glucose 4-epimerase GalE, partial [bacterium]|nr:UDP-glucose 4-epimerase GalE [bacterium]
MDINRNILITGGAGYIGSHVSYLLIENGYSITIIDSLINGNKQLVPKEANLEICDIADTEKVTKILKSKKFLAVLHFAGLIRVDESMKYPEKYLDFNYKKGKIFLDTCFKNDLNKVIFSSTAAVYGNAKEDRVSESHQLNPLSPYAESKLLLENYLIKKSKDNNKNHIVLRYFNVAGADEKMRTGLISNFSTHLIKLASEVAIKKKEKLIINGNDYDTPDGTPIRDYIHISDLADIHLKSLEFLLKNNESEIFNCGYGEGYSVKEVINCLGNLLKTNINFEIGPRRVGDIGCIISNPKKFVKTMSWKP